MSMAKVVKASMEAPQAQMAYMAYWDASTKVLASFFILFSDKCCLLYKHEICLFFTYHSSGRELFCSSYKQIIACECHARTFIHNDDEIGATDCCLRCGFAGDSMVLPDSMVVPRTRWLWLGFDGFAGDSMAWGLDGFGWSVRSQASSTCLGWSGRVYLPCMTMVYERPELSRG
jgi:hypothetical protein